MLGALICLAGMVGFILAVTTLAWRMRHWLDRSRYDEWSVDLTPPSGWESLHT